jgi:hypothetical protein
MANPRNRGGRVSGLIQSWEDRARQNSPTRPQQIAPLPSTSAPAEPEAPAKPVEDDNDSLIQGLTPGQLRVLAIKVYDLLLDEMRLEQERMGRRSIR